MPSFRTMVSFVFAFLLLPGIALAGGAWVPAPGDGDLTLGFSQKTANRSWDSRGDTIIHTSNHDFRYAYLSGELGLVKRLSTTFLVTYLDGREGPPGDEEKNSGLSDAWFGLKYALRQDQWPMAIAATLRTPIFYDIKGPYSRHLFDANGNLLGNSPEWRGLLKTDLTLSYLVSHSIKDGEGWFNLEAGYTLREGAPADQIPVSGELGWPLPWRHTKVKVSAVYVQSLGNDSPRKPDDRFGSRPGYNFNNASMAKIGASFIFALDHDRKWSAEIGYNQWVWGKSARQYDEPFLAFGRRF
ncbi:MAG: hypothetical protein HC897_11190 [Thermoanaerobaculia bacterium]|nr:hypothetical protein [Thermoanaerobaculia bacterium]